MKALVSVSDKEGLVPFVQGLRALGFEIISTGGTRNVLLENGVDAVSIEAVTGFPEMLDGRVKTLHPKIHGGLLARRDNAGHVQTCKAHGIGFIDLVVVNLYPFKETISKADVTFDEAIEQIDIGGPSMLRSAAKNVESVGVIVNPERYASILEELNQQKGQLSKDTRLDLAREAFHHTARYDMVIASYFDQQLASESSEFPTRMSPVLRKISDLRYGENPHQSAAFYTLENDIGVADFRQHHGKELSYNNIMDLEAAWQLLRSFELPGACVIKHTNPCGAAIGDSLFDAYRKAHDADPVSAFGSIVGLNRSVDIHTAQAISETFVEVVVAPAFDDDAIALLSRKPSIRLIELPHFHTSSHSLSYRYVNGGFLVQDADYLRLKMSDYTVVTDRQPTKKEWNDLLFANDVVKHVKSNAIVIAKDGCVTGVGAGQMSRVKSVDLAIEQSGTSAKNAVMASDAFFPFNDSIRRSASVGVKAVIQPGGSKRDQESIDACNEEGMAMVFTGYRHFRH